MAKQLALYTQFLPRLESKESNVPKLDIINYRFLTTETNLKAVYIFCCCFLHNLISKAICSDCTDFCLQLCFSEKGKKHSRNLSHFENENTFQKRTTF